jgi:hypothetical protein
MCTGKLLLRKPVLICFMLLLCMFSGTLQAAEVMLSNGQTVYVPVYSNVIAGPREVPVHLSNTLIIRNTDIHNQIIITAANYYDTQGALIREFYSQPVRLAPLETKYLYLSERDQEGGVGANFVIRWRSAKDVNPPIIECVMVGGEGRAFVSPAQVIDEKTK